MEGQLDLTLPHSFVGIRNFCGEKETDHDSHQRRRHLRRQPSSRTTTTPTTTDADDDDDKLYDDNDDYADALGCFPTRRPLPRASSLACSYLHYRACSTSPSRSLVPRLPEQNFRSQLLPCVVAWLVVL